MGTSTIHKSFLTPFLSAHYGQIAVFFGRNFGLKEQMKGRRLRLTNGHRRRLAAKGKRLGRKTLNRVATIVTPDTII